MSMPAGLCRTLLSDDCCKAFHPALQNIVDDLTHANGNLKPLAAALAGEFAGVADVGGVDAVARRHRRAEAVRKLPPIDTTGLTVCFAVTWADFNTLHSTSAENAGKAAAGEPVVVRKQSKKVRAVKLNGHTGYEGKIAWCTPDSLDGLTGEQIVEALALSDKFKAQAETDGVVVVEIPAANYNDSFHKPHALHGFYPYTPFLPELTGDVWGRTGGGKREAVAAVAAYRDEVKGTITVRHVDYR
jgi:hypothetical protein